MIEIKLKDVGDKYEFDVSDVYTWNVKLSQKEIERRKNFCVEVKKQFDYASELLSKKSKNSLKSVQKALLVIHNELHIRYPYDDIIQYKYLNLDEGKKIKEILYFMDECGTECGVVVKSGRKLSEKEIEKELF